MPETSNIAEMARKVADEIFSAFGWQAVPPFDQNWACATRDAHKVQTHPSDAVFFYEDPYRDRRVYINLDLKSYAKGTINSRSVREALKSLAKSTECANTSQGWRELYGTSDTYRVIGGLFIYNHDDEYDQDFSGMISDIDPVKLNLPAQDQMVVFGPKEVAYLATVANDIHVSRGKRILPAENQCSFYYPDLIGVRPKTNNRDAASLEMLTSPWQIIRYFPQQGSRTTTSSRAYFFYYRGLGDTVDEFKYLIDFAFRYQLLGEDEEISLRMPFGGNTAAALFERAKEEYAHDFYGLPEFRQRLARFTFTSVTSVIKQFSTVQIGMRDG